MIKAHQNEDVYGTATKWFVRLRAENITENEQDVFFEWLFKSNRHQQTFADVLTLWDRLEVVKTQDLDKFSNLNLIQKQSIAFNSSRIA